MYCRTWTRSVSAAACLALITVALLLGARASDAGVLTIKLEPTGYAGGPSEQVVYLNATFPQVKAAVASGDFSLILPSSNFDELVLTAASVTTTNPTSAADPRQMTVKGTSTAWGVGVDIMVFAEWADDTTTQPTYSLGAKVADPGSFQLTKLNDYWHLPTGNIDLKSAYVIWASADQTLPTGENFYLSKDITQGLSFAGKAGFASIVGPDTAEGLGLSTAAFIVKGSMNDDISVFDKDKVKPVVDANVHLEADLIIPTSTPATHWINASGTWKLALDVEVGKDTSFKVSLSGKVTLNDPTPDDALGLPTTALDMSGSVKYETGGTVTVTLAVRVGDWQQPFKLPTITLKSGSLEFQFIRDPQKGITLKGTAKGKFDIGTEQVSVSTVIQESPDGISVKFTGELTSVLTGWDVVQILTAAHGSDVMNAGAHAALDNLQISGLKVSIGMQTGTKAKQNFSFGGAVTYKNVGADLLFTLELKSTKKTFFAGISPRVKNDPNFKLTLGDLDSSLVPPVRDIQLPDFALILSTKELKGGKEDLPKDVFEFLRDLYGCPETKDDCDIDVNLTVGASVVTAVPIPQGIKGLTDKLWIPDQPIILGGSFPLFGQGDMINLFAQLPDMSPSCNPSEPDPFKRAPEWFVKGKLGLHLAFNPQKLDVEFGLEGELGVRLRKGDAPIPPAELECGDATTSTRYDHLEFNAAATIELSAADGAKLTFTGGLKSNDPQGWQQAFGIQWLTIKDIQLELSVGVPIPPVSVNFGLGFRGNVVIGTKDIDTSFLLELKVTASPPWVVPNFIGFRFASVAGLSMQDIANLASAVSNKSVTLGSLPNLAMKRIEVSFSREDKPKLCLPLGLIIGGDLYINPVAGYTPPDFTTCKASEEGAGSGAAQTLLVAQSVDAPQPAVGTVQAQASTTGACGTPEEVAAGCFTGIRLEISDTGILARAAMGAWNLGPVAFDDALVELIINAQQQSLKIKGGVTVQNVGQGSLSLSLAVPNISFSGDVNLYNVFWAHLEGKAGFTLQGPQFDVSGFMKQEIGRQINEQLAPFFLTTGASITVINGVIDELQDPNKSLDDVGQKILTAPAQLQALGVSTPQWLVWFTNQMNNAISTYEANNAGQGPLTVIINGVLQGSVIKITNGVPGQFTQPACLGTWDTANPPNCWTTLPVPATSYQICIIGCTWVTVPAIPGIPGIVIPSFCPGVQIGTDCWTIPPITLDLPGLCDVAGAFGANPLAPYNCDATGLKNTIVDLFENAFQSTFNKSFDAVQAQVQSIADEMMKPGFIAFDAPCLAFDMSMADLQTKKAAFAFAAHVVFFNKNYYLGIGWDFGKSVPENVATLRGTFLDVLLRGAAGSPTNLCAEGTSGGDVVVRPPSNLQLTAPASATEGSSISVSGTYNDPDARAGDTVTVTVTWGDGTTVTVTPASNAFTATHTYADDNPTNTSSDQATISGTVNNSRTGSTTATKTLTVQNANPVLSGVTFSTNAVNEGGTITVTGSFSDPGTSDTHSLTINWGDGSSSVPLSEAGGAGTFTATHTYQDDNPTGTQSDVYGVALSLRDDDGGVVTETHNVTVNNLAPSAQISIDKTSINEGGKVTLTGSLTDAGALDTHTVAVTWGDGTSTSIPLGQGVLTFTADHYFVDDNPTGTPSDNVTVSAIVTDDDGGASQPATAPLTVNNVAPSNVTLKFGSLDLYENDTTGVVVSFNDPGIADTYTIAINWGDGHTESHTLGAGQVHSDVIYHKYLDDNPTGTPSDTYTIGVTVTDDDTGVANGAVSQVWNAVTGAYEAGDPVVTVRSTAPLVRIEDGAQQVQYSDPLAKAIVVKAWDVRGSESESQSAWTESLTTDASHVEWKLGGGAFQNGLPGSLSMTSIGCAVATSAPDPATGERALKSPLQQCSWKLQGVMDVAPGIYTVRVHVVDDDTLSGSYDTTITVLPEDAVAYYVGPTFAATVSASDGTATIPLRATIRDISSVPASPLTDKYPGDITDGSGTSHAHVAFVDRDTSKTLCEADARVAFVGDKSVADASCNWTVVLPPAAEGQDYSIGLVITGWYTGKEDLPAIVTVSRPLPNFATGGGYLLLTKAAGMYPGDVGSKSNFGFNVKFDPKSRKVHGRATVIVRSGGHVYQIRMPNADTLGIVDKTGQPPRTAQFEGKANLIDITDPLNPVSLAGNLAFQMRMTDNGSQATDTISWTLWDGNGLVLFSSNWSGTSTTEQALGGGDLSVLGGN